MTIQRVTAADPAHFRVPLEAWLAVDLDLHGWEAHQPSFGDAGACVQGDLDLTAVLGGCVRDLDHEQDMFRLWVGRAVGVGARD